MQVKEYAVYKNDEIMCIGTIKEIAKELKIKEKSVMFYGTKSHTNRTSENARRLVSID